MAIKMDIKNVFTKVPETPQAGFLAQGNGSYFLSSPFLRALNRT